MPAHRKENPIRRNLPPQYLALPAEGRKTKPPAWPLAEPPTAPEKKLWAELWKTPMAVMWERNSWFRIVARYVRHSLEVEGSKPQVKLLAEVRALEDRLGMTPKAMESLRWRVVADEVAEARTERTQGQSRSAAARKRLAAVPDAASS